MSQGEFQVVTSTLTLTEVLVHLLHSGNVELSVNRKMYGDP